MRRLWGDLAAGARVPVFPVAGRGAADALRQLELDRRVRCVDTPRAASVLLVAGELPRRLLRPAVAVHDQMPHPRCTLWWPLGGPSTDRLVRLFPVSTVGPDGDAVAEIVRAHAQLLSGERASEPAVQADEDPAPWRGVGPYGQGGKGMTGGVPFGRPMPGRAPDRDGLELDQLEVRVGPFFAPFPPGLELRLRLQGDVIQEVDLAPNPFLRPGRTVPDTVFRAALSGPTRIAELEIARARHHLRWLAHALRIHGLWALGLRVARLARDGSLPTAASVERLGRLLEGLRALSWATADVGVLDGDAAAAVGGPVARAAGLPLDARLQDPEYEALGFEPRTVASGDARARWRQRLAEAVQALGIAERAGERRTRNLEQVEAPQGPLTRDGSALTRLVRLLPGLLAGLEWGKAVTTVVSLDLDLEEAAR